MLLRIGNINVEYNKSTIVTIHVVLINQFMSSKVLGP